VRYGKVIDFKCAPALALRPCTRRSALAGRLALSLRRTFCALRPPRMSELRVIELLDGLCDALSNFALWTPSAAWVTANPEADHDRRWVRITGAGADVQGATGACIWMCSVAVGRVWVGTSAADAPVSFFCCFPAGR
jgi:hypothetical protein